MTEIKKFAPEIFTCFDSGLAMVGSGNLAHHNAMTISWGQMGTLWHRPVITVFVKPIRFTYSFMEENEYFVVSLFKPSCRKAMGIMGSLSGRDENKEIIAGLTPIEYNGHVLYREAKISFICRKIYHNDLVKDNIPAEEIAHHYSQETPHRMYIGEVVEMVEDASLS